MAGYTFHIKKNSSLPSLRIQLRDFDNVPIDLTEASSVGLNVAGKSNNVLFSNSPGVIENAASGIVRYDWDIDNPTDLLVLGKAGRYKGDFVIKWSNGQSQNVPSDEYITIIVVEDVA